MNGPWALRVDYASDEGSSENFRVFCTDITYDVILQFHGGGGNCPRFPAFWRADSISRKLLPTCHSSSQHSTVHDKTGVPKTHTITHGQVEAGKGQVRAAGR